MKTLNTIFVAIILLTTIVNLFTHLKTYKIYVKELRRQGDIIAKKQYYSRNSQKKEEQEFTIRQGKMGLKRIGIWLEFIVYSILIILYIFK